MPIQPAEHERGLAIGWSRRDNVYPSGTQVPQRIVKGLEPPTQAIRRLGERHIITWLGSTLSELMGSRCGAQLPNVEANRWGFA